MKYETFILPQEFSGNAAIIFNSDGAPSKDTTTYIIPSTGILHTTNRFVKGDYIITYLQENGHGYDTLAELVSGKQANPLINQIIFPRVLTFQRDKSQTSYTVLTFYVGRKTANELEKHRFNFERQLEQMLLK